MGNAEGTGRGHGESRDGVHQPVSLVTTRLLREWHGGLVDRELRLTRALAPADPTARGVALAEAAARLDHFPQIIAIVEAVREVPCRFDGAAAALLLELVGGHLREEVAAAVEKDVAPADGGSGWEDLVGLALFVVQHSDDDARRRVLLAELVEALVVPGRPVGLEVLGLALGAHSGSVADLLDRLETGAGVLPATVEAFGAMTPSEVAGLLREAPRWSFGDGPSGTWADLARTQAAGDWARAVLVAGARHLGAIRDGRVPYASDAAFVGAEVTALCAAAHVALLRDQPDAVALIEPVLLGSAVAPGEARSAPSQAVAMGIGAAVAMVPTPEALEMLRRAGEQVRHRGVVKKLAKHHRDALNALPDRPEVALRLPPDGRLSAAQRRAFRVAVERSWMTPDAWPAGRWVELFGTGEPAKLARGLVWWVEGEGEPRSVLGAPGFLRDSRLEEPEPPREGEQVRLWHPLRAASQEREQWREVVRAERLRQPFAQVFREFYPVRLGHASEVLVEDFEGLAVQHDTVLAVARSQGWHLDFDTLVLRRGPLVARMHVSGSPYPGSTADGTLGAVVVARSDERPLDPVAVSEILRSVDLLASTAGFADLPGGARPRRAVVTHPGSALALRRDVVAAALADEPGARVEARHVQVGTARVHLTTGRVTRDGEPVAVELDSPPELALPWVPHDDRLVRLILSKVEALLAEG